MAAMMGLAPERLGFLRQAKAEGLGDYDLATIDVIGELKPLPDFKLPPLGGSAIQDNAAVQDLIAGRTRLRPKADPALCTACGHLHRPVSGRGLVHGG